MPGAGRLGREDAYLPLRFGRAYADALPRAELLDLERAGHWPWLDRPDAIDRIVAFLAAGRAVRNTPFTICARCARSSRGSIGCCPGILDAGCQFLFFFLAYQGYQVVRGLTDSGAINAYVNAHHVMNIEQSVGAFFEPGFQQTLIQHTPWLVDFANFMYLNSHFVITTGFLAWLYLFRNEHFYFVRNMFLSRWACSARLRTVPDRAATAVPEPRVHRHDRAVHRRRPGFEDGEPPAESVRGGAEHAHRLLADGRGAGGDALAPCDLAGALVLLSAARLLRDHRHRQPLLVRRPPPGGRRFDRRARGSSARPPAPGGLVVVAQNGHSGSLSALTQ